jgi:undecaprenyl-diphosphatase
MEFLHQLDWSIVNCLSTLANEYTWGMLWVVFGAEVLIAVPFLALYFLWRRPEPASAHHGNQKAVVMAIMALFLALAGKTLLSFIFFRERPFITHPELIALPLRVDPASFPSGHTLIAAAIGISLWQSKVPAGKWLTLLALVIGLFRVAAGVHYPTDVIGSFFLAAAASWYAHREASSLRSYLPNH